eukprot:1806049-Amphidinium_carterae.1
MDSCEPEPESVGSPVSLSAPVLPLRNSAVGSSSDLVPSQTPSSTSSTTIATQTVPLPDSIESSWLSGLPAVPIYVVWRIGDTPTLLAGVHVGADAWRCILSHIPGHAYRSGVDRLRRLPVRVSESNAERLQSAVALFLSEAEKHHVADQCRVHFW